MTQGKEAIMSRGLIMVFTGNGKGKTTAAVGMALRAAGHGMPVCFFQFIKGSWTSGEIAALEKFGIPFDVHVTGKGFTWKSDDISEDARLAVEGWKSARSTIDSGKYGMVVLDELTYLFHHDMLDVSEVAAVLAGKPHATHVVITGRNAPVPLIQVADLVTEMKEIKHPFKEGINAQKGIEF